MTFLKYVVAAIFFIAVVQRADADTFGSGASSFDIEFVEIGNPGNADDTTGNPILAGSVAYTYRIGKFEISEQMIDKANTLGGLGITKDTRGPDKPATNVTWFEAAHFVNWLNTSRGSSPAYKFDSGDNFQLWASGDPGYDPANLFRNSQARYFLPSVDEWCKAAYFDPNSNVYYDYPTGSDSEPDGIDFPGDSNYEAVYLDSDFNEQPNNITDVGVLSPYGTAGQGGNAYEWEESEFDLVNDSVSANHTIRGGNWRFLSLALLSTERNSFNPSTSFLSIGFRVASVAVPEPSTLLLIAGTGMFLLKSRIVKRVSNLVFE